MLKPNTKDQNKTSQIKAKVPLGIKFPDITTCKPRRG